MVSETVPKPALVYEDEDFGEWDDIHCSACYSPVPDDLRDTVLSQLTTV